MTWSRTTKWLLGTACVCLVLATAVGCGGQDARTRTTQPVMTLSAGDSLGRAVFSGGTAETILAARETENAETLVAGAE